jgi:hypothetical protein
MGVMESHDDINRRQGLLLQIGILKQSQADSELSWAESKLTGIRNTVSESIRRDIAEKESLLNTY